MLLVEALLKSAENELTFKMLLICYEIGQVTTGIHTSELEIYCWKLKEILAPR